MRAGLPRPSFLSPAGWTGRVYRLAGRAPGRVPRRRSISSFWQREDPQFPGAGLAQPYLLRLADLPFSTRHLTHGLVLLIAAVVAAVGGVTATQRAEAEDA